MSDKPSQEQVIRAAFNNLIKGVWTTIPCVVVAVDKLNEQRVDVKPLISQLTRNSQIKERPIIYAVPLVFPSSKRSAFTFSVQTGDVVLCVFSMRGLEAFKTGQGTATPPLDFSSYEMKDAIAIPGLFPWSLAVNNPSNRTLPHSIEDAVVTHNIGEDAECEMRLLSNGGIKITTPGNITVECDTANVNAATSVDVDTATANINASSAVSITAPITTIDGNLTVTGNTQMDGSLTVSGPSSLSSTVTSGGTDISNSHTHGGVSTGSGDTQPPN